MKIDGKDNVGAPSPAAAAPSAFPVPSAETIVSSLKTAGGDVPESMRTVVYGESGKSSPSLMADSAEGVTTFGGMNGYPGSADARSWIERRLGLGKPVGLRSRVSKSLRRPGA